MKTVRQVTIDRVNKKIQANPQLSLTVKWEESYLGHSRIHVNVLCNKCGTEDSRTVRALYEKGYSCRGCISKQYHEACLKVNTTYIKHIDDSIHMSCNVCSSILSTSSHHVMGGCTPKCLICLDNKYKSTADKEDYDYLYKCTHENKRLPRLMVRCRKCSHEFSVGSGNLAAGKTSCYGCQISSYRIALSRKNCTFVSTNYKIESRKKLVVNYTNATGDNFQADSGAILAGNFTASLEGHWREQHNTYLIITKYGDSVYCKIGTANHPETRMLRLKLLGESVVFTLDAFEDRFGADQLESELHREFKDFKLDRAIANSFTTATVKVKRKGQTERVSIKDGTTEWFTHEVYDILKTRYNLEKEENGPNSNTIREVTCSGQ